MSNSPFQNSDLIKWDERETKPWRVEYSSPQHEIVGQCGDLQYLEPSPGFTINGKHYHYAMKSQQYHGGDKDGKIEHLAWRNDGEYVYVDEDTGEETPTKDRGLFL